MTTGPRRLCDKSNQMADTNVSKTSEGVNPIKYVLKKSSGFAGKSALSTVNRTLVNKAASKENSNPFSNSQPTNDTSGPTSEASKPDSTVWTNNHNNSHDNNDKDRLDAMNAASCDTKLISNSNSVPNLKHKFKYRKHRQNKKSNSFKPNLNLNLKKDQVQTQAKESPQAAEPNKIDVQTKKMNLLQIHDSASYREKNTEESVLNQPQSHVHLQKIISKHRSHFDHRGNKHNSKASKNGTHQANRDSYSVHTNSNHETRSTSMAQSPTIVCHSDINSCSGVHESSDSDNHEQSSDSSNSQSHISTQKGGEKEEKNKYSRTSKQTHSQQKSKRKPNRAKMDKLRSESLSNTDTIVPGTSTSFTKHHARTIDLAIPTLTHDDSKDKAPRVIANTNMNSTQKNDVLESSTQTESPGRAKCNTVENAVKVGKNTTNSRTTIREPFQKKKHQSGKMFRTNAAGRVLLDSLSKVHPDKTNPNYTESIDSSKKSTSASVNSATAPDSLEVNLSETSMLVIDDPPPTDLSLEKVYDQGYECSYGYNGSLEAEPYTPNSDDMSINIYNNSPSPQNYDIFATENTAGYYYQQQPYVISPQQISNTNGSQEYFPNPYMNMQYPMFIPTTPCTEFVMPQPYSIIYEHGPSPNNVYDNSQVANNNTTDAIYIQQAQFQVQAPLKYEQVSVGGTVYFNPVYATNENMEEYADIKKKGTEETGDRTTCDADTAAKEVTEKMNTEKCKRKKGRQDKKSKCFKKSGKKNSAKDQDSSR